PAVRAGDELLAQSKFDEAFETYRCHLATCQAQLAKDGSNAQAQHEVTRAAARLGLLADRLIFVGAFEMAIKCANEAITALNDIFSIREAATRQASGEMPPANDPSWIHLIRVYAVMFLGDVEKARTFFRRFDSNKRLYQTSWETLILRDFAKLREAGHSHPLMTEIEAR